MVRVGYHGGSLTDLLSMENMAPPTERLLRDVADAAGEKFTEAAADATPKRSGVTAASWRTLPAVPVARGLSKGWESGTTNPHWVARFLEHGTEAHLISPKTRMALGLPVGARAAANHPGIRAHHMTAHAAVEVEAMLPTIADPHLDRWQRTIEGGASTSR